MQLIIQSYLKTFLKHWVSTLGTLLFIMMLACVVLGLMSTPLQLQSTIQWAKNHSTSYNWVVDDEDINYSESFAFDYFILDGYDYTAPTDTHTNYLLDPWKPDAQIINPEALNNFLNQIKTGSASKTDLQNVLLSATFYLYADQWANSYVNSSSHIKPPGLEGLAWWDYFTAYLDPSHTAQEKLFLHNFIADFSKFITTATQQADSKAVVNFTYNLMSPNLTDATPIAKYFVDDLTDSVTLKIDSGDWFTEPQKLYLYNTFLRANQLTPITSIQEWNPQIITNQLITAANENAKINGLAIEAFNPQFRQLIVNNYHNDVEAYLVSTALTTLANPRVTENNQPRYEVQTKVGYSLSETIAGSFTPSFSTDVRAIGDKNTYNHILMKQGREPTYVPRDGEVGGVKEIVVSPSFLKKNKMKVGDLLTLPQASFSENIDPSDSQSQDVAGGGFSKNDAFTIVGTGFTYDELIPGTNFTSFIQPLKDYTYSYLPNNYVQNYKKAAFLYYSGSLDNHPIVITNNVKDLIGHENPYDALIWSNSTANTLGYGMFRDAEDLVKSFYKLKTISGLNTIKIQLIIYISLGLVSLVLAFIFINFIIKKEINETRRQLGIFKSFGYGIAELSLIFATKTLITITIGIVIGWVCSIPLQLFMSKNFSNSVMFTYQSLYLSAVLLVTLFLIIPLLFTLVSYLLTLRYLKEPALLLINNRQKMPTHKPHNGILSKYLERHDKGFKYRLSGNFVKTAMGKFVVVQLLFGFSALLYTLIFGARTVMYQVINQSFNQIHSKTDHEYAWANRDPLVINDTTDGRYSLQNIDSWNEDKINYVNYQGYDSPAIAMNDPNNPTINSHLNLTRYSFRAFFDALSNSVVHQPATTQDLNNWWLLPESIALERYAKDYTWDPDLSDKNYYLYKVLLFKGADYSQNSALTAAIENMKQTNTPYGADLQSPDFNGSWLDDSWGTPTLIDDLKTTFLGLISQDKNNLTNNFFLTDLGRLFAMVIAENYITTQLKNELKILAPTETGRYDAAIVRQALNNVYQLAYSGEGKLRKFDPRNSLYWGFTEKNPLLGKQKQIESQANGDSDNSFDLNNLFKDVKGITFSLLASAMIAKQATSMTSEPVVNFNNFFYNSDKEQLQLELPMLPENRDWGKTSLLLSDFNKNSPYGSPDNVYNFDGVSSGQWSQMLTKPGAPDEPYFNGILPYAIAQLYDVKLGDTIQLTTKTSTSVPIKVRVNAINRSVTLPLTTSWQINVDYNIFARTMFTQELQDALGISPTQSISSYYFNGIISQNPMVDGKINVTGIGESLDTIRFVGNQLTISLAKDKMTFSSLWQMMIDYLLDYLDRNSTIPPPEKEKIKEVALQLRSQIHDPKGQLITSPMVVDSDDNTLVSIPYNLVRIGVRDFASTMNQLMTVFLLLQSVLLMITLIVVMNIVVDEAAVIILTLRALGYTHNEINWIIMGPYVFWAIISFLIAYVISMVAWRLLLTFARNKWGFIIHFRFSIIDLVVPFCVLAVVMLIGWLASDYTVNRRPLTQITDGA